MRLGYLLTAILAFCSARLVFSQQLPKPPMYFGNIPEEQLKMTIFEQDTAASAVVLCNYGQANVEDPPGSIRLRWEHQKRIKILKKEGYDYANITIPFFSYNKTEEFFFDKAAVYLPDGQVIKLTKKDVFVEKLSDRMSVAKIIFPKLEVGCVIEYAYFINSSSVHELRDWYFQEDIPVLWSEIRVDFPEYLHYVYFFQGNDNMEKQEEGNGVVNYRGSHGSFIMSPRRYVMIDAPGLKEEGFVTTMNDYLARIRFQLSEVRHRDGRVEKVLTNWKELQSELEHASVFGEQFLKKSNYKKLVEGLAPLAADLPTKMEKIQFFYNYLTLNVDWNGNYSAFTQLKKLDEIFDTRKANSAELNLMLYVLLREADITAYPVLTSTRSHGRIYEDYPIIDQFNHLMLLAVVDGNSILLDATEPLRPPGYPSTQALNGRGLMLNIAKDEPSWMNIAAPKDGMDILLFDMALTEDGTLNGTISGMHKGYNAIPERRGFLSDSMAAHWKKRLIEKFPDTEIGVASFGNLTILDKPFYDTLQISIPNAAQVSGDMMYLPSVIWTSFRENMFKMKERNYPVDIPFLFQEQLMFRLTLPDGYRVESMPEAVNKSLPGSGGSFFFATSQIEQKVQVSSRLNISKLRFMPDEYAALKEFFDLAIAKFDEQLVIKKM
ncbi:MAG: DUF3857 domain-containing protein [Bacteroidetes bacterium]|nr:DUF3857 domain-containing protein [Bacteroidota bacterium]